MPTEPRNADNDMVTDDSMPYNRSMEALDHVVKASKLTAFKLLGAATADGEGVADGVMVKCEVGLFVLKMTCAIKDVVAFAAIVHKNLLSTQGQAQRDDRDRIFGFVSNAIFYLKRSVAKLQQLVGENDSIEAESSGVKLPNTVEHVRQWASNASSFAERSVDTLLDVFSTFLSKSTENCKKVCPAWEAIMRRDGALDYALASKIMRPNMVKVVAAHNLIYDNLRRMSASASMLEISPRLQEHKITAAAVATSQAELGRASQVSIMILGINLIFDFEGDVAGPKKAAAFIEAHKTPKNADLPEGFWRELELMSKGGVGVALPSVKAEIKSTPQKRRPSASPECSAKSDESGPSDFLKAPASVAPAPPSSSASSAAEALAPTLSRASLKRTKTRQWAATAGSHERAFWRGRRMCSFVIRLVAGKKRYTIVTIYG